MGENREVQWVKFRIERREAGEMLSFESFSLIMSILGSFLGYEPKLRKIRLITEIFLDCANKHSYPSVFG
jgi:hypothetical protein